MADQSGEIPDLLTIGEVASALRVWPSTVLRWVRAGNVGAMRLPGRVKPGPYRIYRVEFERLLEEMKIQHPDGDTSEEPAPDRVA